jgi:cysteine synthase A
MVYAKAEYLNNKKYLSTDLLREEPAHDDDLSPGVHLAGFDVFKRVCVTCWEPTPVAIRSPAS